MTPSAALPSVVLSPLVHGDSFLLGLTVRRTYPIFKQAYGSPSQADSFVEDENALRFNEAFAPLKPTTDVLVFGDAWSSQATPERRVLVRVGPVQKELRVLGPRRFERTAGGELRLTEPEPFTRCALSWSNAFGGVDPLGPSAVPHRWASGDRQAEPESDGYPRNPRGCGYISTGVMDRLLQLRVPSVEDPGRPLTVGDFDPARHWMLRPAPESFGPTMPFVFPRIAFWVPLGLSAEESAPLPEVRSGWMPRDVLARTEPAQDSRVYLCAPQGLSGQSLRSGEPYELVGMHPEVERIAGTLPVDCPGVALLLEGVGRRALETTLKTVVFRPSEGTVTLTWTATLEVLIPYTAENLERVGVEIDGDCITPVRGAEWPTFSFS